MAEVLFDERGGGWMGGLNWTWPFFRLKVYRGLLQCTAIGNTHEIHEHELVRLRRARRVFMTGIAIEHNCPNVPAKIVFVPRSRRRLESALDRAGFKIEGDYSWPGVE